MHTGSPREVTADSRCVEVLDVACGEVIIKRLSDAGSAEHVGEVARTRLSTVSGMPEEQRGVDDPGFSRVTAV